MVLLLVSHGSRLEGGAEMAFVEMVQALSSFRPHLGLCVVVPADGEVAHHCRRSGADVHVMPLPRWASFEPFTWRSRLRLLTQNWRASRRARLLLRRVGPAAVVTNTMTVPCFAQASHRAGLKHYWFVHEYGVLDHELSFAYGYRRTRDSIVRGSAALLFCSRALQNQFMPDRSEHPTHVVYQSATLRLGDHARRSVARGVDAAPLRVGLLGRYSEPKGHLEALEALAVAVKRGADLSLAFAGPGDRERFRAAARRLDVSDRVEFGPETDDVAAFWGSADVALMTSRLEAFGRVTVEALRCGVPVVGFSGGGTDEIVQHGRNGLLSPTGDVDLLADSLFRLWLDRRLLDRLADAAPGSVEGFSQERYAAALTSVFGC